MEAIAVHTCEPTVNWKDITCCISVVESKRVTPIVKQIYIPVYFDNSIFFPKNEKSSVVPVDMCIKPCSGPIISQRNTWTTGFMFYPNSDI